MLLQGWDPVLHTIRELQEFCERIELVEDMETGVNGVARANNNSNKRGRTDNGDANRYNKKHKRAFAKAGASHSYHTAATGAKSSAEATNTSIMPTKFSKYCELHGPGTHSTGECKVLIGQAKKMKAAWTNKDGEAKRNAFKKKQEMNAIFDDMVKTHVEKKKAATTRAKAYEDDDGNESPNDEAFNIDKFSNPKVLDYENTADTDYDYSDNEEVNQEEGFNLTQDDIEEDIDNYINGKIYDLYPLASIRKLRNKNPPLHNLAPITIAHVQSRPNDKKVHRLKVLLDSGASATIIQSEHVKKLPTLPAEPAKWTTNAGVFTTHEMCSIKFTLPEFFQNRTIDWKVHVDSSPGPHRYDMIIGRDLLREMGITLDFSQHAIIWDNASILMKDYGTLENKIKQAPEFHWHDEAFETEALQSASERIKKILDAKYDKADLNQIVEECDYLNHEEQMLLLQLLKKHEHLFDGTLGRWDAQPYNIELKPDAKPYHSRAFPIPRIHENTLHMELERLCSIGVLRKVNQSEWAAPTFIIPKKDGSVRFISDFRELNKRIKRKPFPIPNIQDLLRKLEGFMYATSLDLNMGYYHITLSPFSRRLCTIVTPWGKYEYQRLPMGLCNSADIFQERMSELMEGLEYVRAYIDDVLLTTCSNWQDHINKLDEVFTRLGSVGLKVNAKKSFFGRSATEYLGFWITRTGISPLPKKVEAINNIATPTTQKQLRRFIGMVNYYRDMWIRRSDTLTPLTALCSKNAKWRWTSIEQKAFATMKKIIGRETLLTYPQFNRPFDIYTDASHTQLGAVVMQDNHPVAFYSRKLNPAQTRYTTTERELLSIVETLKEFRNILLGQQINVYTDHKNLTYKNFNTERVMRWRLIIEEFSPNLIYIKGTHNVVADALSRLEIDDSNTLPNKESLNTEQFAELYGKDPEDLPSDAYPLEYRLFYKFQQQDKALLKRVKQPHAGLDAKTFRGGGQDWSLICHNGKIVVPEKLRQRVITWYHEALCHPGINRTEETIGQHLWWPKMRDEITEHVTVCPTCQKNKKQRKKYGHMPEKEAEAEPWDKMCVDLIGPYTIKRKGQKPLHVKCVTMIDPATGWFEIAQYNDKQPITIANIVERYWLNRYPLPTQVICDRGSEFMGHDFVQMLTEEYGIKRKPISVRNPQANAILERVHQTLGNMVRAFELEDHYLDEDDPWAGILNAAAFAIRSTYHTTLKASPGQLVFGRDMIFNIKHVANWHAIKERKQKIIQKNNENENSKRIRHEYKVGDKVLLERDKPNKYESPYEGPYIVEEVNTNGTVRLTMGAVTDVVNLRRLQPFKTPDANRGGECSMRLAKKRRKA